MTREIEDGEEGPTDEVREERLAGGFARTRDSFIRAWTCLGL